MPWVKAYMIDFDEVVQKEISEETAVKIRAIPMTGAEIQADRWPGIRTLEEVRAFYSTQT